MLNSHNFASDIVRDAAALIDDAVTALRNRGHTREHAVRQAALFFGLPESRAKGLLYGKVFALAAEEYRAIKARFLDHLDAEADYLAARSQAARARRKQMEMEI